MTKINNDRKKLSQLQGEQFEELVILFINDKYPSIGLYFPPNTQNMALDKSDNILYIFSTDVDLLVNIKDKRDSLTNLENKKIKKIRYITNKDITSEAKDILINANLNNKGIGKIAFYSLEDLEKWYINYQKEYKEDILDNLLKKRYKKEESEKNKGKSNSSQDNESLSKHNIHQKKMLDNKIGKKSQSASSLLAETLKKKTIPEDFLTGINNELIKSQYFNTYSLWLSLLFEAKTNNLALEKVYSEAINLALDENNIQTMFLCDETSLSDNIITQTLKILFNDYKKYGYYMYHYREKLSSFIKKVNNNSDDNKSSYLDCLITDIETMISNDEIAYIDLPAYLIKRIVEVNKLSEEQRNKLENLIELLIGHINNSEIQKGKYNKSYLYIFMLQDIIRIHDENFNAYEKFAKTIHESYKKEFEIDQIIKDFYSYYIEHNKDVNLAIEKYHDKLISIIWDLVSVERNKTKASYIPDTLTDNDNIYINRSKPNYLESVLKGFVEKKYHSTDYKELPIIPPALRNFILEAFDLILYEIRENKSDVFRDPIYSNSILSNIKGILLRMSNDISVDKELGRIKEIFFNYNKILNDILFTDIEILLINIIHNLQNDENKIEWLKKSIDLGTEYDSSIYSSNFINIILDEIKDYEKLKQCINIIKKRYDDNNGNQSIETIYKLTLRHLKHKNNDILNYYIKDYNDFWKKIDVIIIENKKTSKRLLKELKKVAVKNIKREVKSLFKEEIFEEDAFEILEAFKANDSEHYKYRYNSIVSDLSPDRYRQYGEHLPEKLPPYYNQIILLFLWQMVGGITKEELTKLVVSEHWVSWIFIIIINYCIDNSDETSKTDKDIDFKKEYTNCILEHKKAEFDSLFKKLENLPKTNTIDNIKLIIYIWLQKNDHLNEEFSDEDIYNFIQCIGINGYILLEPMPNIDTNIYSHLEDTLGIAKEKIIIACKKYIEKNTAQLPIKDSNTSFILRCVIKYLTQNIKAPDNINIDIDIDIIKIYLSSSTKDIITDDALTYIKNKNLYKKVDDELEKQGIHEYIESLDNSGQYYFLYYIVLKNKDSFPKTLKSLKELFNKTKNNSLKYNLAFVTLDKHSEALQWLTDYFIKDGDLKNLSQYNFNSNMIQNINDSSFNKTRDIDNLITLIDYSFKENRKINSIYDRKQTIAEHAFKWLFNSVVKNNFDDIKTKLTNIAKNNDNLYFKLNATNYLRDIEEKAYSK